MSTIVTKAHELILGSLNKDIAVDATCGNGYDTLFLLQHFKIVYAFDIQELAIKRTRAKTEGFENLYLINDDFKRINQYVKEADAIMFNLGYLPGSDRKVRTFAHNSFEAILKAYEILNSGGIMTTACYTGHEGGLEEFKKIKEALNSKGITYNIYDEFQNRDFLIEIRK
jgi:16S rRNA C1402 N4-methylase RsmH